MKKQVIAGLPVYQFEIWQKYLSARHFISTRDGGVSTADFESLNLSFNCGDYPDCIKQNREILAKALNIKTEDFYYCRQIHSDKIISLVGKMDLSPDEIYDADAIITNKKGICIFVLVADCVPILLLDPVQNVIAAVHAGWQGTVKRITENTVKHMQIGFGSDPGRIIAGIGPCIGPDCYEVGNKVKDAAGEQGLSDFIIKDKSGKLYFDLPACNKYQLKKQGIASKNIEMAAICSHCCSGEFYSHRASANKKQQTGRFAAGVMLI